ncbi:MAG: hypothetical protein EXR75_09410 [Myxococcales bacterium]|nr:hypothetical protein [Myxococcales bacterium]
MNRGSAIVGMILCLLAGMGLARGVLRDHAHGGTHAAAGAIGGAVPASQASAKVPVDASDPSWGSPEAPVTVVLYSDYQCPYCTKVEPTMEALKQKYGPENLRVVWKHFPLPMHQQAVPAHVATQTVFELGGNDAFWKMHALTFANQRALTPENFAAWATQSGVDGAKFKAAFESNKAKAKVDADVASGSKAGVSGTPASFVNGIFLSGARPVDAFVEEIDKQLAEAKALILGGTPKGEVYTKLTEKNHSQKAKEKGPEKPKEDTTTVWRVPVLDTDPKKGAEHALVTIVEFSDYECPFCGKVEPAIKELMATYAGKLRVVWKDNPLPFHKRAFPAAYLAREAKAQKGDEAFWKAHELLFANNKALSDEDLAGYADKLGLDVAKAKEAISSQKFRGVIEECQAQASDFQAGGTPHFFINGRRLSGAQPAQAFKTLIDEELKKAEALLAKGVKAADMYAELTKDGKAPPPPETKDVGPPPDDAPWKGAKDAVVVIQEFSDFECPFCGRVNDTIKQILERYGKDVKVVWRHKALPFHANAPLAHQATVEAFVQKGNDGFWKMHDRLFAGQKDPGIKREQLEKYGEEIGLDVAKLKKALDGGTHKARVEADIAAADKVKISGTPGFAINGYFISGAQGYPAFRKVIELALKEAREKGGK